MRANEANTTQIKGVWRDFLFYQQLLCWVTGDCPHGVYLLGGEGHVTNCVLSALGRRVAGGGGEAHWRRWGVILDAGALGELKGGREPCMSRGVSTAGGRGQKTRRRWTLGTLLGHSEH